MTNQEKFDKAMDDCILETQCMLEIDEFTTLDIFSFMWQAAQAAQDATIAQLQLENAKMRYALSAMLTFFGMDKDENNSTIFKLAEQALGETK